MPELASSGVPSSSAPVIPEAQAVPQGGDLGKKVPADANVTPQSPPPNEQHVLGREERVEYRDQDGNLLNEEQVAALEKDGKVSFKTQYETRTRLVDAQGNEINPEEPIAPQHPDAEGQNPDTKGAGEDQANSAPANANVGGSDVNKEDDGRPRPASDASAATK